uniref:Uncharacterized protein n=1 Tax=Rhodnius prolixus TaxID=13249 RepID=T1HQW5_RHOPR
MAATPMCVWPCSRKWAQLSRKFDFVKDDFGTDDFGTDDFGKDDFGTDDFGTDDFGKRLAIRLSLSSAQGGAYQLGTGEQIVSGRRGGNGLSLVVGSGCTMKPFGFLRPKKIVAQKELVGKVPQPL